MLTHQNVTVQLVTMIHVAQTLLNTPEKTNPVLVQSVFSTKRNVPKKIVLYAHLNAKLVISMDALHVLKANKDHQNVSVHQEHSKTPKANVKIATVSAKHVSVQLITVLNVP